MMMSVTKLIGELVKEASKGLAITMNGETIENPDIKYMFGSSAYIKDMLDNYSRGNGDKFPLVALFTPVRENRGVQGYASSVKLNMLIACSSTKDYTNEEREEYSFENILRPIYTRLMAVFGDDVRVDVGYGGEIPHEYSENYSYGRYGAYTESGEEVSEPIDAINIRSLELKINFSSCR